jgi:hypothetical protein
MRRAHLIAGLVGVLVFLATGLYMRSGFPELYGTNEALRYMYRANHIYILFASLVNVALGVHLAASRPGWRGLVGRIGSVFVMLSLVVLCYAFFAETPKASPERLLTALGVVLMLFGVVGQVPSYRRLAPSA